MCAVTCCVVFWADQKYQHFSWSNSIFDSVANEQELDMT